MSGGPTAFVFPGQGSQFPGMGREIGRFGAEGGQVVARAEDVTGLPVAELMAAADAHTLADPEIAQVLVFVWSAAALARLHGQGGAPGTSPDTASASSPPCTPPAAWTWTPHWSSSPAGDGPCATRLGCPRVPWPRSWDCPWTWFAGCAAKRATARTW